MASDEDNFDIDIYGDGDGEGELGSDQKIDFKDDCDEDISLDQPDDQSTSEAKVKVENNRSPTPAADSQSRIPNSDGSNNAQSEYPRQAPQPQGVKRKETSDERSIDAGATNNILISDLRWWTTEDDIRGWVNQAGCEDELKEISFSEHKVNGKSKGQAFIEFSSPQAATATKHKIDSLANGQPNAHKHTLTYSHQNIFKTLPKDAPARGKDDRPQRNSSVPYTSNSSSPPASNYNANNTSNFRGGRGGFNNRGGFNHNANFNNRNFTPPMGGYNNPSVGYQNPMPMMNNFGGFNRGGMNGMRGGRGGMGNGMMPMGGMGMGIGMNPMMQNMGMQGFQGNNNQFNGGMFNQGNNPGWNQHGVKRQRQE